MNVKTNTPPTYIVHCADDDVALPENSTEYIKALNEKGIENKLTIYPKCGHGWDWESKNFIYAKEDRDNLVKWLKSLK